ncbi:MAG: hypothetical protein PHV97_01630 [Candidatus Omnitrophica bacterium]|nr:hypothetical protein [Candidatus Omnitrophota bacterium]
MQKLSDTRIKIIHRNGQKVSEPLPPRKGLAFFGFFASSKVETRGKNAVTVLKEPVFKSLPPSVPRADLAAVKSWVALEERIVQDYTEQKTVPAKSPGPLPKNQAKKPLQAFETFTTQTAVSLSSSAPKLRNLPRSSPKTFSGMAVFLLACGLFAAGVFVFSYAEDAFSSRETSQRLTQLQNEKEQLGRSYAALRSASEDQSAEMKWLNSQLHEMALELKTTKAGRVVFEQGLERKYREELMRITVRYEAELAALRGVVENQNAIVEALRAQSQAFEKIIDQAGMSALSGAAAGFSQEPFSTEGTPEVQGEVTSVSERQGSVVINVGATDGVRSGRQIKISRGDIGLATGRIDRVYPTMSVATVRDGGMLQVIQEGDSVSFS